MRTKIHEWLLGNVREAITSADDNKADANADASVEKAGTAAAQETQNEES